MQKTIRLHRQHDMDLISLYRIEGFRFPFEMKQALRACATGKTYRIRVPKQEYKRGYVKRSILLHISLHEGVDDDIIQMLRNVKQGQCNSFMKAVFRNCLDYIPFQAYGKGSGFSMSLEEAQREELPLIPEPERERYKEGERPASVGQERLAEEKNISLPGNQENNSRNRKKNESNYEKQKENPNIDSVISDAGSLHKEPHSEKEDTVHPEGNNAPFNGKKSSGFSNIHKTDYQKSAENYGAGDRKNRKDMPDISDKPIYHEEKKHLHKRADDPSPSFGTEDSYGMGEIFPSDEKSNDSLEMDDLFAQMEALAH